MISLHSLTKLVLLGQLFSLIDSLADFILKCFTWGPWLSLSFSRRSIYGQHKLTFGPNIPLLDVFDLKDSSEDATEFIIVLSIVLDGIISISRKSFRFEVKFFVWISRVALEIFLSVIAFFRRYTIFLFVNLRSMRFSSWSIFLSLSLFLCERWDEFEVNDLADDFLLLSELSSLPLFFFNLH